MKTSARLDFLIIAGDSPGGRRTKALVRTNIVVGFSAAESSALPNDDRSFFGWSDQDSDDQSDDESTDASPLVTLPIALAIDAEENLDESPALQPAQALAARGQGQPKKSRGQAAPSTVEEVQARVDKGCSCADVNCFKNVSLDTLLTARNTALAMTNEELY